MGLRLIRHSSSSNTHTHGQNTRECCRRRWVRLRACVLSACVHSSGCMRYTNIALSKCIIAHAAQHSETSANQPHFHLKRTRCRCGTCSRTHSANTHANAHTHSLTHTITDTNSHHTKHPQTLWFCVCFWGARMSE